ncbi:MAG: methyl-accepting chemotaxis protein [Dactylosporangium sp.]|nr:methyl-accepting chemotaxis protein [Dactylosporangium sp.]NNJ63387.1 methyl-accepting chemotaxis protein [Dactylosporangium sp.]
MKTITAKLVVPLVFTAVGALAVGWAALAGASAAVIVTVLAVGLAAPAVVGFMTARSVVTAVRSMAYVLDGLAKGDLTRQAAAVPGAGPDAAAGDELGRMAIQLNQGLARLRQVLGQTASETARLGAMAGQLSATHGRIADTAGLVSGRTDALAQIAQQVSSSVQTASAGSSDMTNSIQDISGNATEASTIADAAFDAAMSTRGVAHQLSESSTQISSVVNLIASIVEQTNLLGINASIEAAHAGAAGRGFAVVAGEVKDLAQATASATGDVSAWISAVQAETSKVVESIQHIASVLEKVCGFSTTIAFAVENQTATTFEICLGLGEATVGAQDIAQGMTEMATVAAQASTDALASQQATDQVAQMSTQLMRSLGGFRF